MIDAAIGELIPVVGVRAACKALGRNRAAYYRQLHPPQLKPQVERFHPRALSVAERTEVLEVLHSERFVDSAPPQVYHTLLDEGIYLASVSSMYRILRSEDELKERRRQAVHPPSVRPELVASAPNKVWSWDITKLLGPVKWTYYYLYVVLDIYSRYAVGWMLAARQSAALAERLLGETVSRQGVEPHQLTIHSDRGPSMASKPVALLLADLGVTKSHSRPHCSNDNPYSEAQFKTLKYRPEFPERFGSLEDARAFCSEFFDWYNHEHRHSGIGYHTPAALHEGKAEQLRQERNRVLERAYVEHPERFVRGLPQAPALPPVAWINRPVETVEVEQEVLVAH